jgi:hypothetical protein
MNYISKIVRLDLTPRRENTSSAEASAETVVLQYRVPFLPAIGVGKRLLMTVKENVKLRFTSR